jgi:flagellin
VTASANATTGAITLSSSVGKTIAITTNNGAAGAAKIENATGLEVASSQTVATATNTFTATAGASTVTFGAVATAGHTVVVNSQTYSFVASGGDGLTTVDIGADATASATNLTAAITARETALGTASRVTAANAGGAVTITSKYATSTNAHSQITGTTTATIANNSVVGAGTAAGSLATVGGTTYEFAFADAAVTTPGNVKVVIGANQNATALAFRDAVNAQYAATATNIQAAVATNVVTLTSDNKGAQGTTDVTTTGTAAGAGLAAGGAAGGANGTYAASTTYGTISLNSNAAYQVGGSNSAKAGLSTASATLTAISTIDISSVSGANSAISLVDGALDQVSKIRADLGAVQNRFQSTIASLSATSENLSAARSRILDADYAQETAALTRGQILQQAGTAILAQANSLPQSVLSLLR